MLELTTYTELEIAHRLQTAYTQKCTALHGHRYQVEITVDAVNGLNQDNMIVDFKKLKEVVKVVLDDCWDHASCFRKDDPIGIAAVKAASKRVHLIEANPTLEWMVDHWANLLQDEFDKEHLGIVLTRMTASETARNTVTWTLDEKIRLSADKPATDIAGQPKTPEAEMECDPDAVPYLVSYCNNHTIGSTVVHSSLKAQALYDFCTGAVQPLDGKDCVVVIGITRLPG